mmetsp:Transcript_15036/g.10920  ORF Transcript_15036/g.10920 Transcript_15036/m.10920 type:complete len:102 (+) Transcript_15036:114-419(+)
MVFDCFIFLRHLLLLLPSIVLFFLQKEALNALWVGFYLPDFWGWHGEFSVDDVFPVDSGEEGVLLDVQGVPGRRAQSFVRVSVQELKNQRASVLGHGVGDL